MRALCCAALVASIVLGGVALPPSLAQSNDEDRAAAAVAAAVIGAGAIAAAKEREREGERDRWRRTYTYRADRRRFDATRVWSPARGVTCYGRLRQCYEVRGGYSARWTRRAFF